MKGISGTEFSPDSFAVRAQLMTMLARIAGLDTYTGDTWYAVGMAWAIDSSVSDGSSPNVVITREQLVSTIYRYMGSPDVKGTLSFSDSDNVIDYALDTKMLAVENGIVEGIGDNRLAPQGNATHARVAAILMRFLESIA